MLTGVTARRRPGCAAAVCLSVGAWAIVASRAVAADDDHGQAPPAPVDAEPRGGVFDALLGGSWSSKGSLGVESRAFRNDGDARTADQALGFLGRLEVRHAHHGPVEEKARAYGRLDHFDQRRTVLVPEEAWIQARGARVRLRAGVDVVNWTATEAFHPADVINARNLDSDLENLEKLGEPMVELQVRPFEGSTIDLFFMPYFTSPRFTSPASRLSFVPPDFAITGRRLLGRDGTVVETTFGAQAAIQIRQVIGSADITVHAVHHMDRSQPQVLPDPGGRPFVLFQTVIQVGGTYQQALGPIVAKVEAAARRFVAPSPEREPTLASIVPDRDHAIVAAGVEYGIAHTSGSESTFVVEGQAIFGADGAKPEIRRGLSPFQRDLLVGWRFAANDAQGREVFLGAIADLETWEEALVNVSYQQRLGETWVVAAGLRLFEAPATTGPPDASFSGLRRADHVRLTLTRHF